MALLKTLSTKMSGEFEVYNDVVKFERENK